ncbi:asparaginase [Brevibacillus choshinensis]|uniref:Asparaginase n=1 Tax=Brevibacillus choshinensis TaxID=54911 RepID=A0ABX7FNJ8_BRECH|nr:asparaginase [Brevibacillus choshinensis]QRG66550.1 asparaginase [Brevibacillus choshinensis]
MKYSTLVEEYRGGVLENVHYGVVCGVNDRGEVIYSSGDDKHVAFLRSAAKPFQAIPVAKRKIDEKFGLTSREAALFTASHRGEAYHMEALESLLAKTGIAEEELLTHPTYPLNDEPKFACLSQGIAKRRLFHNCSGKHLGYLALSKECGYSTDDYYEVEHPAQQEALAAFAELADYPKEQIQLGVDGCGFPVFALPLKHLAIAYSKLACPDLIADEETRQAVIKLTSWMTENPDIVASHHFTCTALLQDPNIIAKGGAMGVYGFALKKERISFALKVIDGSELVWPLVIAEILRQIGYDNRETIQRLEALVPREIKNDNQRVVGEKKAVFALERR